MLWSSVCRLEDSSKMTCIPSWPYVTIESVLWIQIICIEFKQKIIISRYTYVDYLLVEPVSLNEYQIRSKLLKTISAVPLTIMLKTLLVSFIFCMSFERFHSHRIRVAVLGSCVTLFLETQPRACRGPFSWSALSVMRSYETGGMFVAFRTWKEIFESWRIAFGGHFKLVFKICRYLMHILF